ncbi:MAG: glycosyltransferase family 4 protein, partial [Bacteroidota bacterium]
MRNKVLFIGMHRPNRSPSQRYRFEQYFPFLEANGIQCDLSYLIGEEDDKLLYKKGHYWAKLNIFLKSIRQRRKDIKRAKTYDYIFIQREAFMTGTTWFEKQLVKSEVPVIFDFDDAIWTNDPGQHLGVLGRLKRPEKTSEIISLANKVIAGNQYLANYASEYNKKVEVIPTTIDTRLYQPSFKPERDQLVIGWTGSFSTIKHFEMVLPVLKKLKERFGNKISFSVIGDASYVNDPLNIKGIPWNSATEVEDLQAIDIGIMPLPDEEWTRGKCGAKGLQYMGLGIPTIMSPVGVNTEIIQDGENGFLASSDKEWVDKISRLIESSELREKLG